MFVNVRLVILQIHNYYRRSFVGQTTIKYARKTNTFKLNNNIISLRRVNKNILLIVLNMYNRLKIVISFVQTMK